MSTARAVPPPSVAPAAAGALVRWYGRAARDLPWRHDPTPYRVWISEVMLQQTTVAVAGPYFERFVARYPGVEALAAAPEEDVLALWSGLGYYHRARNLLEAARRIQRHHGGEVPADRAALLSLPGIGAYTAGAILSIAFNLPEPAIDGNIMRVVTRLAAIGTDPAAAATRAAVERLTREMIPRGRASSFIQALMDLGATVCVPGVPRCADCPVRRHCAARRAGLEERIPARAAAKDPVRVRMTAVAVIRRAARGRRCLLLRRGEGALMPGMWEFPMMDGEPDRRIAERLARRLGGRVKGEVGRVRHTITRHRMEIAVYEAVPSRAARPGAPLPAVAEPGRAAHRLAAPIGPAGERVQRWIDLDAIASGEDGMAMTGTARKIAKLLSRRMR